MVFRHVILDRDGVLNCEAEGCGYVRDPSEFHWLPGALEGLAMLKSAGLHLSVATNQSAVGRGLMSLEQLEAVHERMQAEAVATDKGPQPVIADSSRTSLSSFFKTSCRADGLLCTD